MKSTQVTWLSRHIFKGIVFELGDNGPQLFYEARSRGITWMVLRPKPGRCWFVIVERKGSLRTLNHRDQHWDGTTGEGPLWGKGNCIAEEPITLLEALADFVLSGNDPFARLQN